MRKSTHLAGITRVYLAINRRRAVLRWNGEPILDWYRKSKFRAAAPRSRS